MDVGDQPIFGGGLRRADDIALEQSGLLGARRRWTNINRYEIIFLVLGVLASMVTDGLTIYRLKTGPSTTDPDYVYGVLIIINSVFLLLFLITGILQQRITDIVAFFISALTLTIYVVVHFILRKVEDGDPPSEATLRLVRLIFTVSFNILFVPFSIYVIRDYQRDEFSKRLFGAFPAARWPLKIYNIFDCVARIGTMFSISVCFLNLYNFNDFKLYDEIFLGVGIFVALLWLVLGVGMIRLESRILMGFFGLISIYQPGFLIYCLVSAIDHPAEATGTNLIYATTPETVFANSEMTNLLSTAAPFSIYMIIESARKIPVTIVLYTCIGLNAFTHILTLGLAFVCIRNFGKGLKERIFNSRMDKFFQRCCSRT